jgi:hypothetical protein
MLNRLGSAFAQLFHLAGVYPGIEGEGAVGMGRADDVGDALCSRQFGHCDRGVKAVGTVVQTGQKMMMDIDHVCNARVSPPSGIPTPHLRKGACCTKRCWAPYAAARLRAID